MAHFDHKSSTYAKTKYEQNIFINLQFFPLFFSGRIEMNSVLLKSIEYTICSGQSNENYQKLIHFVLSYFVYSSQSSDYGEWNKMPLENPFTLISIELLLLLSRSSHVHSA